MGGLSKKDGCTSTTLGIVIGFESCRDCIGFNDCRFF